jgi:hypothetical protein
MALTLQFYTTTPCNYQHEVFADFQRLEHGINSSCRSRSFRSYQPCCQNRPRPLHCCRPWYSQARILTHGGDTLDVTIAMLETFVAPPLNKLGYCPVSEPSVATFDNENMGATYLRGMKYSFVPIPPVPFLLICPCLPSQSRILLLLEGDGKTDD